MLYPGHKYFPHLRLNYINTFLICTWLGWLSVGINSSLLAYFVFGFFSQGYLRRYKPALFAKWNNICAAAIAGGCSLIIFILTFAVAGGSGKARDFPVSTTPLNVYFRLFERNLFTNWSHCEAMVGK